MSPTLKEARERWEHTPTLTASADYIFALEDALSGLMEESFAAGVDLTKEEHEWYKEISKCQR